MKLATKEQRDEAARLFNQVRAEGKALKVVYGPDGGMRQCVRNVLGARDNEFPEADVLEVISLCKAVLDKEKS